MNANVFYFCSFCKPTFSGATREWDALYKQHSDIWLDYYSTLKTEAILLRKVGLVSPY
jgi:hypothetical protein